MKVINTFLLVLAALMLNACGDSSSGGGSKTELEGTWLLACNYEPDGDIYTEVQAKVKGDNYTVYQDVYQDAACSMPLASAQIKAVFTLGDTVILSSGESVVELDATINSAKMSVEDDNAVAYYNFVSFCGRSDWDKGVMVDVTDCTEIVSSTEVYDIYKLDGDKLYMGDSDYGDGETPQTRPTQLDSNAFIKQ